MQLILGKQIVAMC